MGLSIVGYRKGDSCSASYSYFRWFREWCLDQMPLDFQLAFRLWADSTDPVPRVPDDWLRGMRETAWEFFSHSDCEGEFLWTEDMADFLACLKDRASSRNREKEVDKEYFKFLTEVEGVFRNSDMVVFM